MYIALAAFVALIAGFALGVVFSQPIEADIAKIHESINNVLSRLEAVLRKLESK